MHDDFIYNVSPARILFGAGKRRLLTEELERAGHRRALVLCTAGQQERAAALHTDLGECSAGVFAGAHMHTPVEVTAAALQVYHDSGADCVIAFGGGTAIGLGKAIAYRTNASQIALPCTYAGSEVTPILGQTEHGVKTTVNDPSILPEVVIYDPELTLELPLDISITSALNAMAHALEGLYAQNANPITSLMAMEGIRALHSALPGVKAAPNDLSARTQALYGAWLCGSVLGAVGMSLHHQLCHMLGGSFGLPHAQTHAILLPHTIGYNQHAAATQLAPATALFGADLGVGLFEYARSLGAPQALQELGLRREDLQQTATLATQAPYWNPRKVERQPILQLLQRAWAGEVPLPRKTH